MLISYAIEPLRAEATAGMALFMGLPAGTLACPTISDLSCSENTFSEAGTDLILRLPRSRILSNIF
jgi:hypothetical protein